MLVIGVVTSYDSDTGNGCVCSSGSQGEAFQFSYARGCSVVMNDNVTTPVLIERPHQQQPNGGRLKEPEIGDPILLDLELETSKVTAWGYARHYVESAERRYGTRFR